MAVGLFVGDNKKQNDYDPSTFGRQGKGKEAEEEEEEKEGAVQRRKKRGGPGGGGEQGGLSRRQNEHRVHHVQMTVPPRIRTHPIFTHTLAHAMECYEDALVFRADKKKEGNMLTL